MSPARLLRALRNFLETYPAFIALALALVVTGKAGGLGATGAWLWLLARVLYVALYAAGIPLVRTLVWAASIVGLVLMLVRLISREGKSMPRRPVGGGALGRRIVSTAGCLFRFASRPLQSDKEQRNERGPWLSNRTYRLSRSICA